MVTTRLVAEGLLTDEQEPRLIAGRCEDCAAVTFPRQAACPRCSGRDVGDHILPREGRLWSWTVQRYRPKPPYRGPEEFEPYGVGYIEFPGECIVEARLATADPAGLVIGAPMCLGLQVIFEDADGAAVTTYAFTPVGLAA